MQFSNQTNLQSTKSIVAALMLAMLTWSAEAKGVVGEHVRFVFDKRYTEVKAGGFVAIPLPRGMDGFEVSIKVHNQQFDDIDALVCRDAGVRQLKNGQSVRCPGVSRGRKKFSFSAAGENAQQYLVINNSFSLLLTKKISYSIAVVDRLDHQKKKELLGMANGISSLIQEAFEVPEFDVAIRPCGQVNAFSRTDTGDITICSELIFQEIQKKRPGALQGIIFHEVGHSLLNLWNIPGHDNEELVDEFAIVMMHLSGDQGVAYQMADYFSEVDAHREAISKIYVDSRHPLSPQRVRNIKRLLNNPENVIERWNQILYPRMTVAGLKNLLQTSPKFANKSLARKYIEEKERGGAIFLSQESDWGPPPQQNTSPPQ